MLDPTETIVALKTGLQVERKVQVVSPQCKPGRPLEGTVQAEQETGDKKGAER